GTSPSAAPGGGKVDTPDLDGPASPDTPNSPDGTSPSSAPSRPGDPVDTKTPETARRCENDPVDVATGEMVLGQTDVELGGLLPLVLRRTHVSSYRAGRSFGRTWASTVDQRLEFDGLGVVYVADDGMLLVYPVPPATGEVLPSLGPRWPMSRTEDGYEIRRPETGQTWCFGRAPGAWLRTVRDRNGARIDFDRDDDGRLSAVRHSGGHHIDVDTADGLITRLRLRNPAGADIELTRYAYDDADRLVEVLNSSGAPLRFDYDGDGRITQWTDRNGEWYRYVYDDRGRCVANVGSGGALDGTFDYGEGVTRFTDALGQTTTYHLDTARRVVAEVDPLGNRITREWDDHDRLLAETDPLGNRTTFDYDEQGNLIRLTRPDGSVIEAGYESPDRMTRLTEPTGAVWRWTYDDAGNLATATDPLGATTRYEHDSRGHLSAVVDAVGNTRRIETDAAGLAVRVIDPAGAVSRYVRDAFGRIAAIEDPRGGVTRFGWTVEGKPGWRTLPDGTTERWRYDGEGNQVEHVDPLGQVTRTETTHFDLPAARIAPDGARTEFSYDGLMRLTAVTNPLGQVWRYEYDAVGNLVRETDFNGRSIEQDHDAAGRVVRRRTGPDQVVDYIWDALGNVVETRTGDGDRAVFRFDAAGNMVGAVNGSAEIVFERDLLGRVLRETVNGRSVVSAYDPLGRRVERVTPSGATSTWSYDGNHRPTLLRTAGRTMSFGYDPAGNEVERLVDTGTILAQAWDANHQLTSQTLSALPGPARRPNQLQQRSYRYRPDGYVQAIGDRLGGSRQFDLDPVGRVTAVQAHGWGERYAYDAGGNLTGAAGGTGETQGGRSYAGTLLTTAGNTSFGYDRQGRMIMRRRVRLSRKPDVWHYRWDSHDRLVGVVTPDGARWRYHYDALGRRISKARVDENGAELDRVDFVWDGTELAEQYAGATGAVTTWDWEPGGFRALTQVERTGAKSAPQDWVDERFYAIVTDLVGSPTELVDTSGRISWQSRTTLWGEELQGHGGAATTPLRFPGQYFDPETGFNYNYHRYYDPSTGRYGSPDPLGLAGGHTPHNYVANPVSWFDPLGLTACDRLNWSPRKNKTPAQNAYGHWKKHGKEFPHLQNARQYVREAHGYMDSPPPGSLSRRVQIWDGSHNIEVWDPATNRLGVRSESGVMRTYHVVDPSHPSYSQIVANFS
ncbi:RHS repeat-associated core domain-containing protein, partial [Amycolatopsis endophytica]